MAPRSVTVCLQIAIYRAERMKLEELVRRRWTMDIRKLEDRDDQVGVED
jgi:hypothetical protein